MITLKTLQFVGSKIGVVRPGGCEVNEHAVLGANVGWFGGILPPENLTYKVTMKKRCTVIMCLLKMYNVADGEKPLLQVLSIASSNK